MFLKSHLFFLQGNYETLGVKSMLIITILALVGVIVYLYKGKEKQHLDHLKNLTEKDEKIMKIIKDHQDDLKASNNDLKTFAENYHKFTQQLKDVINAKGI